MKIKIIPLLVLVSITQAYARPNALEKEMTDYARGLIRAYPELAEGKKNREARDAIYKKIKDLKLLELTKEEEKKLRKRDAMVTDAEFSKALEQIKASQSKKPEILYLIKYAENPKIKADEKLLAYRIIKQKQPELTKLLNYKRKERLSTALQSYTSYKASNNKIPASLSDLELQDQQLYTNPVTSETADWIYIGHPKIRKKIGKSFAVLAEPESYNGIRYVGLDNGKVFALKERNLKLEFKQILTKIKKYNADLAAGKIPPTGKKQPAQKKAPAPIHTLMQKIIAFKNSHQGKLPATIDELPLTDKEKQYIDPKNGKRYDWIYYGNKSRLNAGKGVTVILIAPKPNNGQHVAGLSNGSIAMISAAEVKKKILAPAKKEEGANKTTIE